MVILDLFQNLKREGQGGASFFTGYDGAFLVADTVDEMRKFFLQRVAFCDVNFLVMDVAVGFRVDQGLLRHVVERDIGVVLENTDFSDDVVCHAAGGQVANRMIGEADTRV